MNRKNLYTSRIAKLWIVGILQLASLSTYGAFFYGRIVNTKGKPLREAVVVNHPISADYTDNNGRFCIYVAEGDTLIVKYIGEKMKIAYDESMQGRDIVFSPPVRSMYRPEWISDDVEQSILMEYSYGNYKECVAYCMYYIDEIVVDNVLSSKHLCKEWEKPGFKYYYPSLDKIGNLSLIGAEASYQYIRSVSFDRTACVKGLVWSMGAANIYEDYLYSDPYKNWWSPKMVEKYIIKGEKGIVAASHGKYFTSYYR